MYELFLKQCFVLTNNIFFTSNSRQYFWALQTSQSRLDYFYSSILLNLFYLHYQLMLVYIYLFSKDTNNTFVYLTNSIHFTFINVSNYYFSEYLCGDGKDKSNVLPCIVYSVGFLTTIRKTIKKFKEIYGIQWTFNNLLKLI